MAVPKRKVSKSKVRMRRANQKTAAPGIGSCPECGEAKMPHAACPGCGMYRGRNVITVKED